jgi:Fe-S-cluster-containing hydrogenase component 2
MNKKYEQTGVLSPNDLILPKKNQLEKGVAISECIQLIPCDPCVDSCPVSAISMKDINSIPIIDYDLCIGCGNCVGVCPGLALFLVRIIKNKALITLPYEFLPVPLKNQPVEALNRKGESVDTGIVKKLQQKGKTWIITVEVDKKYAMDVRNLKVIEGT